VKPEEGGSLLEGAPMRSGGFACGIRVRARPSGDHDLSLSDLALWA
jgi:hypothetical protein